MTIQIDDPRSGCPINLTIQALGDRWSLIVIRDVMFGNRRHFRELLSQSEEGIASNILAARLKKLVAAGFLAITDDPSHKQKHIYNLTEPAIQLVPLIVQLGAWGRRHLPVTPDLAIRAQLLEEGGPEMWADFMDELRTVHLGAPPTGRPSVAMRLQAADEGAVGAIGVNAGIP
jgi:DNA-binding HxlR family transcriptional regulator